MCFSVYALTDINNLFVFVLYTGNYRVGQKSALQIFSVIIHRYDNNNNNDRLTAFDPGQPG